jgi:acyl carrier protein
MELEETLIKIISEETGIPVEEITSEQDIFDDLDMNSLDLMNVVMNVEDTIGLKVELDDFLDCRKVGDFSDRFRKLLPESVPQS